MTHATSGRPKVGRHPAMWQSVPIGSFIRPSTSQCVVLEEQDEISSNANITKKDMSGLKNFAPKKKDGICHWSKNNNPSRLVKLGDQSSYDNQRHQTGANLNPNSAQRRRGDFSKNINNATRHPSSHSQTFISSEDDFPSLSSPADSKTSQAVITTKQTASSANASYSEKLKLAHHVTQHDRIEISSSSAGNGKLGNNCQRSSSSYSFPKCDKKSFGSEDSPMTSTPMNKQDRPKPWWPTSHGINKKPTFAHTAAEGHFDHRNVSAMCKTQDENQRGKTHRSHLNARESYRVTGRDDIAHSYFLSKAQGGSFCDNFNASSQSAVVGGKADASRESSVGHAKTKEGRNDLSQPLKFESKHKRPTLSEVKEKCFSSEVPNNCENMPSGGSIGKMRTDQKNKISWPSKTTSRHPASGDERDRHGTGFELPTNREKAENSQQGTAAKTSKKRKNRKSKIKRNLAFQTGKIMILTPELYSRFTGNLASSNHRTMQDFSFDLSDMEEYPELGQVNSLKSDQHKKTLKLEVKASITGDECGDPAVGSGGISTEIISQETSKAFQIASPQPDTTAAATETSEQSITDEVEERNTSKCEKPCCVPRKRVAIPDDSAKISASEEKESPPASEQKPKNRHDGSIQISFSDILSSTMVKIKSEASKSKKQNDSRVRVISSKKVKMDKNLHIPPNALDSSRPVVKRGKERERPKPKKHTILKRIILKERSEKKLRRSMLAKEENSKNVTTPENEVQDLLPADKEEKTEPEVDTTDPEDNLLDFSTEEFPVELHEEMKSESLDQNLNISVELQDQSLSEKATEEICDPFLEEKKMQAIQIAIHTHNFREYCNHLLSAEIDQVTLALLGDLTRFQDRLHQKDPVKARIKRRLVYGIKEVTKHLKLKKVKCVILAPDSENIKSKGGLNDAVTEIVRVSTEYHIPCVFALRRKTLGKACLKPVPVSCVGVFNYDGSEMNFKKLIELQAESKKAYDAVMASLKELIAQENVQQLIEARENSPQSLQALRITILREKLLDKNPDLNLIFTPSGNVQMGCKEE